MKLWGPCYLWTLNFDWQHEIHYWCCVKCSWRITWIVWQGNQEAGTHQQQLSEQNSTVEEQLPDLERMEENTEIDVTVNHAIIKDGGWSKQKHIDRQQILDTLNGCLCGEVVDHSNSPPKEDIKCREKGCETHWVIALLSSYMTIVWLRTLTSITCTVLD